MLPDEPRYTMDDLTRLTGFKPRQIRYYITLKLAPGAGERGPNVTYGPETLDRLLLVKRLKEMQVQPTGRTLTLEEIRSTIESLGDEATRRMVADGMVMSIIDTEEEPEEAVPMVREPADLVGGPSSFCFDDHIMFEQEMPPAAAAAPAAVELGDLGPLLRNLSDTLSDVLTETENTQNTRPQPAAEEWRRVRTPDLEIQVRVPDDTSRRARLERIHAILLRLLDQGR